MTKLLAKMKMELRSLLLRKHVKMLNNKQIIAIIVCIYL